MAMSLTQAHRDACLAQLGRLLERTPGIQVAALGLRDGRAFAQMHREPVDAGKLAAMASSLTALGATTLRELSAGALDHVLIEGEHGKLVLVRLPELSGLMILAVQATAETRLGLVLGQARTCAVALGEVLARAADA